MLPLGRNDEGRREILSDARDLSSSSSPAICQRSVKERSMPTPIPIVIDTDGGADPDDAIALALALASPDVDVRGVTTVDGDVELRARMAARLLGMGGRPEVPVVPGASVRGTQMMGLEGRGLLAH